MEIAYVLIPLGLAAGFMLGGLLVVSYAAHHQADRWQADKDIYRMVRAEIRKLKHILQTVTVLEWPIWPRPVLYESIDRQTQLAFARAEEALTAIRKIDSSLRNVPVHPNRFSALFNLARNLAIWQNASANLRLLQNLRVQQQALTGCLQQIGRNHAEVDRLQTQVEAELKRFRQDYSKADAQYLGYLHDPEDPHYIEVTTIYQEMLACLAAAEEAIGQASAVDGKGHAVAHFWQQAAVVFQASFDAACLVHTYSDAYILDKTQQRMDAILNTLRSLDLAKQSQDWQLMTKAYRVIQHQKNAYAFVLRSISEFDIKHQSCVEYKKQLAAFNLNEYKEQADQMEAELAEYLLPGQLEETWQKMFGEEGAPSQKIQQAQGQLDAVNEVCNQGHILQSEIDEKMAQMDVFIARFLEYVNAIKRSLQVALDTVKLHKESEAQVLQRLKPEGQTTRALRALDGVTNNSTEEVIQKYLALQSSYQQFQAQAATRLGANYPDLLAALNAFESECRALVQEHSAGATKLQAQAAALDARVKALHAAATALQNRPPLVEGAWEDIFQQLAGLERRFQAAGGSFVPLTEYLEQAPQTLAWLEAEVEKINQIHQRFAAAKVNLNNHLSNAKKAVDSQIDTITTTWPLPMRDLLNELKTFKNQYAGLRKAFLRLSDIKKMEDALVALDALEKQIQQVESQVKDKLDLSIKQQKQLNDFVKQINSIIQNAQYLNTSVARVESAREIMQAAREKETFADASTLLKWAVSILQSSDQTTKQPPNPTDHGKVNRPGSNRIITSDYKRDVPPEDKRD